MKKKILALQGGPGLSEKYLNLNCLNEDLDVVKIDYPSCGPNDSDTTKLSETVSAVMEHAKKSFKKNDFPVLAHSWGAYILLKIMEQDPTFTKGPIIFACPFPLSNKQKKDLSKVMDEFKQDRLMESEIERLASLKPDGNGASDKEYIQLLSSIYVYKRKDAKKLFDSYNRNQLEAIYKEMGRFDITKTLNSIKNKVHVILGAKDFVTEDLIQELIEKSSEKIVIPEVGHSPFIENPTKFRKAILQLLK